MRKSSRRVKGWKLEVADGRESATGEGIPTECYPFNSHDSVNPESIDSLTYQGGKAPPTYPSQSLEDNIVSDQEQMQLVRQHATDNVYSQTV